MARLAPLPVGSVPELNDIFDAAVFDPQGEVSIDFGIAAASQPNDVTDELFDRIAEKHIAQHGWKLGKHGS